MKFSAPVCSCMLLCAINVSAVDWVFPAAAKVIDITKAPYSADRTGTTDVSAILSKAANDIIAVPSWSPGILYLPNGTYLVKNTFGWRLNASGNGNGPLLLGQSRTGAVIKLAKGTWPLGTELKGVIQTGAGVEQNFSKDIRNLTVLVDSNNAGAIGIVYVSTNTGLLSDVNVISADGKGAYGIQSAGNFTGSTVGGNGPFIIRRTYIKGFQVGLRACGTQSSMVSQIRLEGQSKYGIWASCGNLTIDSLTSHDTCIAVEAEAPVLLTNAVLSGGSPTAYGIRNFVTSSFFRDVKTTGYKFAVSSVGVNRPPLISSFAEYSPSGCISLFSTATASMNLPARFPPEVTWENDFTKWAFIEDYRTGGRNDAQALQAAIDDPAKTTVCLVGKNKYQLDRAVYVRGAINRIIGTGAEFASTSSTNAQLIVDDGTAPVVMIQNISCPAFSTGNSAQLIKRSSRTLVLESIVDIFHVSVTGGGETYITDVVMEVTVDNPLARVYMWQWEGTLTVHNGMMRAVGDYHEGGGTNQTSCPGGFTEILGRWEYATTCDSKAGKYLMSIGNSANVSVAGLWQQSFCNPWSGYDELISETRGATTKILYGSAGAGRIVSPAGGNIALFTAYDPVQVQDLMKTDVRDVKPAMPAAHSRFSVLRTARGIKVTWAATTLGPTTLLAYDLSGRIVAVTESPAYSGIHRALIPARACPGIIRIELRAKGKCVRAATVPF
jgi:hypothetical protein